MMVKPVNVNIVFIIGMCVSLKSLIVYLKM